MAVFEEICNLEYFDSHVKKFYGELSKEEHNFYVVKSVKYVTNSILLTYLIAVLIGVFSLIIAFAHGNMIVMIIGGMFGGWAFLYSTNLFTYFRKLRQLLTSAKNR